MVDSGLHIRAEYAPSLSTEMAFCTSVESFNMKYIFNNNNKEALNRTNIKKRWQ